MSKFFYPIARHWLLSTLFVLTSIFSYTKSPLYGADPTPTPNVSTVPNPSLFFTPTPTPSPVIVIITREAPPAVTTTVAPGDAPANAVGETDAAAPPVVSTPAPPGNGNVPLADPAVSSTTAPHPLGMTGVILAPQLDVRQAPNPTAPVVDTLAAQAQVTLLGRTTAGDWVYLCCGATHHQPGWVSAQFIQVIGGNGMNLPVVNEAGQTNVGAPAVALTIETAPALIWQGALVQLHVTVRNTGTSDLTQVTLQQHLPPALRYVTDTIDTGGAVMWETAPRGDVQLALDWPHLPQGAQASATITLQVQPDTPNGLLLESQATLQSREGATAAVDLLLVMPPAALPQFRK
ncbi:MAG: SH3 domain-containing protein [Caldilineaceae bacterium]